MKCSSLHSGNVVLVGDAGHSMFPALGQGCNSAIESASALVELLDRHGGDNLEQALEAYTNMRLPEVSAAADLSAKVRQQSHIFQIWSADASHYVSPIASL